MPAATRVARRDRQSFGESDANSSRARHLAPRPSGAGAAAAVTAALPPGPARAAAIRDYRLVAGTAHAPLAGPGYPTTEVWAYGGSVPGPEIRLRQGERLRVAVAEPAGRGDHRSLARRARAQRHGRRAAPDPGADRARGRVRLRVRRAGRGDLLVSPAPAQLRAGRPRPLRAADRRGARADRGRPRRALGARRLAAAAGRQHQRRLRQSPWKPAWPAGSATRSPSTAR